MDGEGYSGMYLGSTQQAGRQVGDRRITVAVKSAQGVHEDGYGYVDMDGDGAGQVRACPPSCAREQQIV